MPIELAVDPVHRIVRATYTGPIFLPELTSHVRTLVVMQLLTLPQLIDGRRAVLALSEPEINEFSGLMGTLRQVYGRAPVAFVAGDQISEWVAEHYADAGAGDNPVFRLFDDLEAAERWIYSTKFTHPDSSAITAKPPE